MEIGVAEFFYCLLCFFGASQTPVGSILSEIQEAENLAASFML